MKNKKLNIIVFIMLLGFVGSALNIYVQGVYLGKGYPYNTFLFHPLERFKDFYKALEMSPNPYAEASNAHNQFPVLQKISYGLFLVGVEQSHIIFTAVFVVLFLLLTLSKIRTGDVFRDAVNLVIISFLSYPFLFSMDRGNLEILIFLFLCVFAFLYEYPKQWVPYAFLSAAMAIKPFPAVFLALPILEGKYKYALASGGASMLLNFVLYAAFPGGLSENLGAHMRNLALYQDSYIFSDMGVYFGHSLFTPLKLLVKYFDPALLPSLVTVYFWVSVLFFCATLYYIYSSETVFWKKIALLIFCMNMLPYVSGDYKLLHVYVPMLMFLSYSGEGKFDAAYAFMFALLMIPKSYFHYGAVNEGVLLNPLIMLSACLLIFYEGLSGKFLAKPVPAR